MTPSRRLNVNLDEEMIYASYPVAETLVLHTLISGDMNHRSEILRKIQPDQFGSFGAMLYQEIRKLLAEEKPVNLEEIGRRLLGAWASDKDRADYYQIRVEQILGIEPSSRHIRWAIDYVAALPSRDTVFLSRANQADPLHIAYAERSMATGKTLVSFNQLGKTTYPVAHIHPFVRVLQWAPIGGVRSWKHPATATGK